MDARAYVSLGKLLVQQRRYDEAGKVYEDGIAVTGTPLYLTASSRIWELHTFWQVPRRTGNPPLCPWSIS